MIDDLQEEFEPNPQKKERRLSSFLLIFLIWLIYCGAIVLVLFPKIKESVRQSGVIELIESIPQTRQAATTRLVKLTFLIPLEDGSFEKVICEERVNRTGSSYYHDAIEGLLEGPGPTFLQQGAISAIDPDTSLIGLTVSGSTAFVDFSAPFTSSGSAWGNGGFDAARSQVEDTLKTLDPEIRKVVLMVEGQVL